MINEYESGSSRMDDATVTTGTDVDNDNVISTLNGLIVTDTQPAVSDGRFGDGVNVMTSSQASLINSSIINSSRAGVANFGSLINVKNDLFDGNLFHVAGEKWLGKDFNYGDLGGNICGATLPNGFSEVVCQVTSPGLEPPEPKPQEP